MKQKTKNNLFKKEETDLQIKFNNPIFGLLKYFVALLFLKLKTTA
jgi:hypothetical protein